MNYKKADYFGRRSISPKLPLRHATHIPKISHSGLRITEKKRAKLPAYCAVTELCQKPCDMLVGLVRLIVPIIVQDALQVISSSVTVTKLGIERTPTKMKMMKLFLVNMFDTSDQAYHGIAPKKCMFSDREDVLSAEAKHLTFVQNSCPVRQMSEIIDPLANVNQEVYFSKFKTFRFGNQSTVFAHCTVQVCLDANECSQSCFKRIQNSNLTAERLRFRHRRDAPLTVGGQKEDLYNEIAISRTLTILDGEETREVSSNSIEQCLVANAVTPTHILVIIGALTVISLVSITTAVYLGCKRKTGKNDSFDLYSAFSAPTVRSSVAGSIVDGMYR